MSRTFWFGLGDATRGAIYTFLGYYNVCFIGDEVKDPTRTIPRAIGLAVGIVALLYLTMNSAVLGRICIRPLAPAELVRSWNFDSW